MADRKFASEFRFHDAKQRAKGEGGAHHSALRAFRPSRFTQDDLQLYFKKVMRWVRVKTALPSTPFTTIWYK
jgi:hypothetical protein